MSFIKVCKNRYCFIGVQGPTGVTGITGPQNGPRGVTGPIGPTGPRDNFGPVGITGPQGERGNSGTPGALLIRQFGPPTLLPTTSGIIVSNDINSGEIYYFAHGNWIGIGNNKGPTGPIGKRGPSTTCNSNSFYYTLLGGIKLTTGSTSSNVYNYVTSGNIDGVNGAIYKHNTNTNFYALTSRIDLNFSSIGVSVLDVLYQVYTQSQILIMSRTAQRCIESDGNLTLSIDFTVNNSNNPILLPNTDYYLVVSWKVDSGTVSISNSGNHINLSILGRYQS